MALTESETVPLGSPMPVFRLEDPEGREYLSERLSGPKGLLLVFTCNHCPYAVAVWPRLLRLAEKARALGIETAAINPNIHPDYPEDAPGKMREKIAEWGIPFPYLVDATQEVARAFKARCTPDPYLYDAQSRLAYHGRIDDSWQDEKKARRRELWEAVEAVAGGAAPPREQRPSLGCSIKWL